MHSKIFAERFLWLMICVGGLLGCSSQDTEPISVTETAFKVENVFLITLDGFRWEEMFSGVDPWLMNNPDYTSDLKEISASYWFETPQERRAALMPFFWGVIAKEGQLFGNRTLGSEVNVSNDQVFSYPGYNEILTGFADSTITSNDKIPNHNITVLEWLNAQPDFQGKVAAFGSWDVFPYIINEERSGVPVNAGFESANTDLTEREIWLNQMQSETPSPWATVRLDVFTHNFALEYARKAHPRMVYVSYGETDDFAHDKDYDQYLRSAHRTDQMIADLWNFVQSDPVYKGKTAFVITTDHGRGSEDRWIGHGIDWKGSEQIWMALIGPGIEGTGEATSEATGEARSGRLYQNQIAATVAGLLGKDYQNRVPVGVSVLK
ncbi:MAG: sulfatase-like hydrolase/transferase [Bacteroidetes bacterium]|nr:sulfatase-like hydrolase/transferase [Bacteroidota bacterium]